MSVVSVQRQFDDTVCLIVDNNDQSVVPGAIELLLKVVKNVILKPSDEKFRKIKTNNKYLNNKLLCLNHGEVLLLRTGFIKENDEYILYPDEFLYNHLVYISSKLEKFMKVINDRTKESEKYSTNDRSAAPDDSNILAMQQILQFIHQSNSNDIDLNSNNDN